MRKRITLFTVVAAVWAMTAHAGTPQIVINKGQNRQQTIAFCDIERINFVPNGLEIQGNASQTLEWGDVATIHFDMAGETGGETSISVVPSGLHRFEIYSISGTKVLSTLARDAENINLVPGFYIVKDGNKSFKFIKK